MDITPSAYPRAASIHPHREAVKASSRQATHTAERLQPLAGSGAAKLPDPSAKTTPPTLNGVAATVRTGSQRSTHAYQPRQTIAYNNFFTRYQDRLCG